MSLAIASSACGGADDLDKQLDSAASWSATMRLAAVQHRTGAISTRYSVQLADDAKQALEDLHRSLPNAEHDSSDARRATASLDSLDRAIHALDAETGR